MNNEGQRGSSSVQNITAPMMFHSSWNKEFQTARQIAPVIMQMLEWVDSQWYSREQMVKDTKYTIYISIAALNQTEKFIFENQLLLTYVSMHALSMLMSII